MRIYTKAGNLAFKTFSFPDGQPHFKLETYEREFDEVTIETAIKTPEDLFVVLLANGCLRAAGYACVNLDIRYLLGARMDRAIGFGEPFTLDLVARLLNSGGFSKTRILDAHSEVATKLIRNSVNVLPIQAAIDAFNSSNSDCIIVPDKGASGRAQQVWHKTSSTIIYCEKVRDPATGNLSGFKVNDYQPTIDGTEVLIVDDICDGGGTFVGLAKELRKAGATKVYLFVTHGIFSKGLPLEGIDHAFTTNSYCKCPADWDATRRGQDVAEAATIVPVSMREL